MKYVEAIGMLVLVVIFYSIFLTFYKKYCNESLVMQEERNQDLRDYLAKNPFIQVEGQMLQKYEQSDYHENGEDIPIDEIKILAQKIASGKKIRAKKDLQLQKNYPDELEIEIKNIN